ncbi:hypothetical protein [Lentzea albidocapillata]|uniref:hypothetical protein n=1 Tax=Lentzea albidocapillata TaxID=40571 RepID=UPI0004C2F2E6|nr:hypothetical protein [Lentzea albidocapillata]
MAGLNPDDALAEDQRGGARQDGEPLLARVHSELIGLRPLRLVGDAHLGDGDAGGRGSAAPTISSTLSSPERSSMAPVWWSTRGST